MSRPELPHRYEITVAGAIPEEMLATFPGIEPESTPDGTVLRVVLPNLAALQSLLAVVDLFELDLLRVRRVASQDGAPRRLDPSPVPTDNEPETVAEAVAALAAAGYTDELVVTPDGLMAQGRYGVEDVRSATVERMYRFEGDSDPADEAIVLGVHCSTLGVRGVVVSAYGPAIDPDHEAVLRALVER